MKGFEILYVFIYVYIPFIFIELSNEMASTFNSGRILHNKMEVGLENVFRRFWLADVIHATSLQHSVG